jgi:Arm DNA-binding domain
MGAKKFTDTYIASLKPKPARYVWDALLPSFGIYVGTRRKTFVVVQRGQRTKIGHYPSMPLSEARHKARALLTGVAPHVSITVEKAVERYLRLREPELAPGTLYGYRRFLEAFRPQSEHVEDITQAQMLDHLDTIPGQCDRAHGGRAWKTFFNWCVQREYINQNPMANMKMPKEPSARERVLSDDELIQLWRALDTFSNSEPQCRFQYIVKLLCLTGQRRNQFSHFKQDWVDYKNNDPTPPVFSFISRDCSGYGPA